mgnify:CR=1 FL=1
MTYEEFKKEYVELIKKMISSPYAINPHDTIGSMYYAEKLSDLIESVPAEWESRADEELSRSHSDIDQMTDQLVATEVANKYLQLEFASALGVFLQWCNAPRCGRIDRIFGINI